MNTTVLYCTGLMPLSESMFADHNYSTILWHPSHALHLTPPAVSKLRFIREPPVDADGPMCEYTFVYSHSHCAMAGSLFQVSASGLLSVHNVPALGKNTYKLCGQTLAVGIIHCAQSPMCLTPETAQFLVHGTISKRRQEKVLGAIPDADIQGKVQKVCTYIVSVSAISARYLHV